MSDLLRRAASFTEPEESMEAYAQRLLQKVDKLREALKLAVKQDWTKPVDIEVVKQINLVMDEPW